MERQDRDRHLRIGLSTIAEMDPHLVLDGGRIGRKKAPTRCFLNQGRAIFQISEDRHPAVPTQRRADIVMPFKMESTRFSPPTPRRRAVWRLPFVGAF